MRGRRRGPSRRWRGGLGRLSRRARCLGLSASAGTTTASGSPQGEQTGQQQGNQLVPHRFLLGIRRSQLPGRAVCYCYSRHCTCSTGQEQCPCGQIHATDGLWSRRWNHPQRYSDQPVERAEVRAYDVVACPDSRSILRNHHSFPGFSSETAISDPGSVRFRQARP